MLNRNGILSVQSSGFKVQSSEFGVRSSKFRIQGFKAKQSTSIFSIQVSISGYPSYVIRHLSYKIQSLELKPFSFLPPLRYPPSLSCGRQAVGEAFST